MSRRLYGGLFTGALLLFALPALAQQVSCPLQLQVAREEQINVMLGSQQREALLRQVRASLLQTLGKPETDPTSLLALVEEIGKKLAAPAATNEHPDLPANTQPAGITQPQ